MTWQRTALCFMVSGIIFTGMTACGGNSTVRKASSPGQVAIPEPGREQPAGIESIGQNPVPPGQKAASKPTIKNPGGGKSASQSMSSFERTVTPGVILENPTQFEFVTVRVTGVFHGWRGPCRYGPPVSRSDWVIADASGCLYVHGQTPAGLAPSRPSGEKISVTGLVRLKNGLPYLEAGQ